jgi:hypothetical protein
MPARIARAVATLLAASLLIAGAARADGDPASDVLLGQNVFYPYTPAVDPSVQKALDAETAAASQAHFPIKVALIGSPVDLGVIPDLFGKPQKYADFLDQEISFQGKQPLLVVMAAGYGVQGLGPTARQTIAGLAKPAGTHSTDLARAALTAVSKLATAAGHPLSSASNGAATSSGKSGGGGTTVIVLVLVVAAAATAAALAAVTIRRRRTAA